ncbi:Probable adenylyltransferase/sulfurtransferase MoeZ [Geodia barretti]|uniref:Probable adenylyltransferase/sulfurtransferase MoeZ n=1 Tax=Geodia barretti TaxID=519541 RepID=A0AA35T122_GEOBA|nr:Probable adenylyltransferase/sulfurtransferase MoeZ [Geodia barretti]
MPEVGMDGQLKLKAASVLCIGAGGLGSPVAMYLAAAGVGRIGIVDFDVVDYSNLQRQIIHGTPDVGRPSWIPRATRWRPSTPRCASTPTTWRSRRATRSTCSASTTSSSTAPTISPRAIWSMTPACCSASRTATAASSASKARHRYSARRAAPATVACIRSRRRRDSSRAAPRAVCWASCRAWSAPSRRPRRSS